MATTPAHLKIVAATSALAACGVVIIVVSTFRREEPFPPSSAPVSVVLQPAPTQAEPPAPSAPPTAEHQARPWHEVPDELIKYFPDDPQIAPKLRERLASFRISPQEAHAAAIEEQARHEERGLEIVRFSDKPVAIVDRCYVFAEFKWIGISLRGYYVDGDSGVVTWRENPDDVILFRPDDPEISSRLKQRLTSLKLQTPEALKIALNEAERLRHAAQPTPTIGDTPVAIAGRKYVFAPWHMSESVLPEINLAGVYVDGDTGHAEWRERP